MKSFNDIKILTITEAVALGAPIVDFDAPYAEFQCQCMDFRNWCDDNKVYYYAAPAEIFDSRTGREMARERGMESVILENLS